MATTVHLSLLWLLISSATAFPFSSISWLSTRSTCLSSSQAQQLATAYGDLIANYTKSLADAVLAENFTDYSESVNSLIDGCPQGAAAQAQTVPLLAPTFTNRTAFETGQGQQPNINFDQLAIWHSCSAVTVRWSTNNTAPIPSPAPVVGILVLEAVPNPVKSSYPWLIDTVYSEFDAAAWIDNLKTAGICQS